MKKLLFIPFLFLSTIALAFPRNGVIDNFNRSNVGPPPSASWTTVAFNPPYNDKGLKVSSNTCISAGSTSQGGRSYWNVQQYGPNVEVYVIVTTVASSSSELYWRTNTSLTTGYEAEISSAGVSVYSGGVNETTDIKDILQTISNGDSVGISMVGNLITVWYRSGSGAWTSIGTVSNSDYTGAGYIGMGIDYAGTAVGAYDDFGGGTLNDGGFLMAN